MAGWPEQRAPTAAPWSGLAGALPENVSGLGFRWE